MITPKIQFEKQFGQGVDPWHEKAKRWAKKQKFPISFLALGLIEYLKKIWINTKIKNEMASVDAQIKQLHKDWDEEERKQFSPEIIETPSEVDWLNDMSISFSSEEEDPSFDDTHSF